MQSNVKQYFKVYFGDEEEINKVWSWKRYCDESSEVEVIGIDFCSYGVGLRFFILWQYKGIDFEQWL